LIRCLNIIASRLSVAVNETHPVAKQRTLRAIACFEAIKGAAALAGIIGMLDLMHRDVRHLAIELIGRFGQNPEAHFPSIILHYADLLPNANVGALVFFASFYIILRWLEAYGLWNERVWSEWLGALSGGAYIPLEISYLTQRLSVVTALVLVGNLFVVGFLIFQLWQRRKTNTIHISS